MPADRLWRLAERHRVTMLGVSPTLIRALIPKGEPEGRPLLAPRGRVDGRAVEPRTLRLAGEHVGGGGRMPIINFSGGTEVGACFLVTRWSRRSRARSASPRSAWTIDVFDAAATPLRGEVGELVCRSRGPR